MSNDAPEIRNWKTEQRVASKEHVCDGCDKQINAGDVYYRHTWIEDGTFQSMKTHDRQANCGMYVVLGNWPL